MHDRPGIGMPGIARWRSVLVFVEDGLDRAVPPAVVEREQIVGQRRPLGHHFVERTEEDTFVLAVAVETGTIDQTLARQGNDVTGDTDVPINTVAPDQGTVGLQYDGGGTWGTELVARGVRAQRRAVAGNGFYAPAAFVTADLTAWVRPATDVTVRLGVLNVTNARYFEWSNVRGRQATDPVIDRYSSPGISAVVSAAYGW